MKKLLSVILAGALALTAVSPVFASDKTYRNDGFVYNEVNFTDYDEATHESFDKMLDGTAFKWNDVTGATIEPITDDPVKGGTVAKITGKAAGAAPIRFVKGFDKDAKGELVDLETPGHSAEAPYSFVYEFDFLDEGTGKWGVHAKEWWNGSNGLTFTNGAAVGRGNLVPPSTYSLNEWHHVVLNMYMAGSTAKLEAYFDGQSCGDNKHSGNDKMTDDAEWNENTGLRFENGANVKIANLRKYAISAAYDPATAGDTFATITVKTGSEAKVKHIDKNLCYVADQVSTVEDLISNITVSSNKYSVYRSMLDEDSGEKLIYKADASGDLVSPGDGNVEMIIAESASGDVLNYYYVKEYVEAKVEFGEDIDNDDAAQTIYFEEADIKTVGDLRKQVVPVEGTGTTVKILNAKGEELTDDTVSSTTAATVSVIASNGVPTNYTVTYRVAKKVYVNLDFAESDENLTANTRPLQLAHSSTMSQVDDADLGYSVGELQWKNANYWTGIQQERAGDVVGDLQLGDKFVIETTIKVHHKNVAKNPVLAWNGDTAVNVDYQAFNFGASAARNTILLHTGKEVPYEANKWYHIVAEYEPNASCSIVNMWVNGEKAVDNEKIDALTLEYLNKRLSADDAIRLRDGGAVPEADYKKWSIAQYTWYRSSTGYDAAEQAADSAAVTAEHKAVVVNEEDATIGVIDPTMTVATLKTILKANANAAVKYYDASNVEITDDSAVASTKLAKVKVISAEKTSVAWYTMNYADVASAEYTVTANNDEFTISGIKMYTTNEQFLANITALEGTNVEFVNDEEFTKHDKWITDGEFLMVGEDWYELKVDEPRHNSGSSTDTSSNIAHATGTNPNHLNEDGIHIALNNGTAETITGTGIKAGDSYYSLKDTKSYDWRWVFSEKDNSNGGSGKTFQYPTMKVGEIRNIEFSVMTESPLGLNANVTIDNTQLFAISGTKIGRNQNAVNPMSIKDVTYTPGEWMHVVVSVERQDAGTTRNVKVWINGELVNDMGTVGACIRTYKDFYGSGINKTADGNAMSFKVNDAAKELADAYPIYVDDIRYYEAATSDFDPEWQYGFAVESTDDVKVANNEVWLSNDKSVTDVITVPIYKDYDTEATDADLTEGATFFVKYDTCPIIKKYTVREGALGSTVSADGTLTANVGMVDDAKAPAMFVAGWDGARFTNIEKVVKAAKTDDTIVYNLNNIGADTVKVYVWDASLTSLTDVATYTKTGDTWN